MTPAAAFALGLLTPLVAVAPLVPLWRGLPASGGRLLLAILGAAALGLAITLAGPWTFSSHYLRVLPPIVLAATLVRRARGVRSRPLGAALPDRAAGEAALLAAFAAGSVTLAALVVRGSWAPHDVVTLVFPLKHGTFTAIQAGNSVLLNPFHRADPSGRLALDLVRLNGRGNRARRFIPARLTDYEIFGDTVYSPCAGEVTRAVSFYADNLPGAPNPQYPAGNHVVLACGDVSVLLAHLMRGSVRVRAGDRVVAETPLALVGNSGNTSEPHLHLQATSGTTPDAWRRGPPLGVTIDGRFLVANSVVRR